MADPTSQPEEIMPEEVANNPGMRAAAIHTDPSISLEEARNASEGEAPNAAGGPVPSSAENYVPSSSDPEPSNLPSTDHPIPDEMDEPTGGASDSFSEQKDERYSH